MGLIWVLLVGLLVGALGKLFMPGPDVGGVAITSLLGIAGAFVAYGLGRTMGMYHRPDALPGVGLSVVGALLVLFVYRVLVKPRGLT